MFSNMNVAYKSCIGSASSADLCTPLIHARQKIAEDKINELRVACAHKDDKIQQQMQLIADLKDTIRIERKMALDDMKRQMVLNENLTKQAYRQSVQTQTSPKPHMDANADQRMQEHDDDSEGWVSCSDAA